MSWRWWEQTGIDLKGEQEKEGAAAAETESESENEPDGAVGGGGKKVPGSERVQRRRVEQGRG